MKMAARRGAVVFVLGFVGRQALAQRASMMEAVITTLLVRLGVGGPEVLFLRMALVGTAETVLVALLSCAVCAAARCSAGTARWIGVACGVLANLLGLVPLTIG